MCVVIGTGLKQSTHGPPVAISTGTINQRVPAGDCSKQFGSGTAILHSDNNHTHFCTFSSSVTHKINVVQPWPYLPYRLHATGLT